MSAKINWTIIQIPKEARVIAKKAAKKEKKHLGAWVGHLIIKSQDKGLANENDIDLIRVFNKTEMLNIKSDEVLNIVSEVLSRQLLLDRKLDTLLDSKGSWWSRRFG